MSTTNDTGHATNLANFQRLIAYCSAMEEGYNPSNPALSIAHLQMLSSEGRRILTECEHKRIDFNSTVNVRKSAFKHLKSLSTKIVNSLAVSGVSNSTIDNAKRINRRIQGKRANASKVKAGVEANSEDIKTISSSQLSFTYLVEHFYTLISLLKSQALYQPNEVELKVETLEAYLSELREKNTAVMQANTTWAMIRMERVKLFYQEKTGLVDTALSVKAYFKSVYGTQSYQYTLVKGIAFRNIKLR